MPDQNKEPRQRQQNTEVQDLAGKPTTPENTEDIKGGVIPPVYDQGNVFGRERDPGA